jgi:hypothetical protein
MFVRFVDVLFGCTHKRLTFPITTRRARSESGIATRETYVACLHCGREFPYDWNRMKVVGSRKDYELATRGEQIQSRAEQIQSNVAC